MGAYIPFDEREACLNCPMRRCVYERRQNAACPIIKEKRTEHRLAQEEKKRRKA